MAKYYERILPRIKGIVSGLLGVFACSIAAIMVCKVQQIWIIRNVETILFISGLWLICLALVNVRIKRMGFLKMIAEYSMDIYLLSYFVQVPIRVIVNNFIPFEIPYFLIVSGMFGGGIIVPVLVSKYVIRRYKVLSLFLLGTTWIEIKDS